jgi:transcriptional/translational regulatory protein YebC/TACO1
VTCQVPTTLVEVKGEDGDRLSGMLEALDEDGDVQKVFHNAA